MNKMTSRERVLRVLEGDIPDRVPLYAFSVDPKFFRVLGNGDPFKTFERLGLDAFPIRAQNWCQGIPLLASLRMDIPEEMMTAGGAFGGWHGIDEFGRVWERGSYVGGALKTEEDIEKYIPPLRLEERTDPKIVQRMKDQHGDKARCLNFHSGPFGLTIESMGFENFFLTFHDNLDFVMELVRRRTEWFIKVARYVVELGADFVVMGDDVAYKNKTFISPKKFEELVIPLYKRITEELKVPVIWHSDGYVTPLLRGALEAGIRGIHPLEPTAGVDLGEVKKNYGDKLALVGNVDCVYVLCQSDLEEVRKEVRRCMSQAKEGGGYMLSDSNSLHVGCNIEAVLEMYRYAKEIGEYR
ncbi:MAG TPA: uroporphyrinogen decarboxylase family protein [Thermodesulfobacteriota bacterium]|nr:uroporphyrinogen decarboxylase family protein [Thermodesulfobacteriota bacterium]